MANETSQVTLINPRQSKPPSLWMNMATLLVLFGLIAGAKKLSDGWLTKEEPSVTEENHIVMEDLESEKPFAESTTVEMQQAEEPKPEMTEAQPQVEEPKPQAEEVKTEAVKETKDYGLRTMDQKQKTKNKVKQKHRTSHIVHRTTKSPYAQPDPYTDGGPLDLDRPENQPKGGASTVTATPPAPKDERDQFIPFEKSQ